MRAYVSLLSVFISILFLMANSRWGMFYCFSLCFLFALYIFLSHYIFHRQSSRTESRHSKHLDIITKSEKNKQNTKYIYITFLHTPLCQGKSIVIGSKFWGTQKNMIFFSFWGRKILKNGFQLFVLWVIRRWTQKNYKIC